MNHTAREDSPGKPPVNQRNPRPRHAFDVTSLPAALLFAVLLAVAAGCDREGGSTGSGGAGGKSTIVVDGSDTMVNLSQAWAEAYAEVRPDVDIQVSGGGSGVGISSLIGGNVDMANSSRPMDAKEIAKFKENNAGKEPKEHIVAMDALAVYVHKDNPNDV